MPPTWTIDTFPWLERAGGRIPAHARVIADNDFAGDPDDLFQLAHHLLCPAVEIRGIIGSHLGPDDPWDPGGRTAAHAVRRVHDLCAVMGLDPLDRVHQGAESPLVDHRTPRESPAVRAILAEAAREDPARCTSPAGAG